MRVGLTRPPFKGAFLDKQSNVWKKLVKEDSETDQYLGPILVNLLAATTDFYKEVAGDFLDEGKLQNSACVPYLKNCPATNNHCERIFSALDRNVIRVAGSSPEYCFGLESFRLNHTLRWLTDLPENRRIRLIDLARIEAQSQVKLEPNRRRKLEQECLDRLETAFETRQKRIKVQESQSKRVADQFESGSIWRTISEAASSLGQLKSVRSQIASVKYQIRAWKVLLGKEQPTKLTRSVCIK